MTDSLEVNRQQITLPEDIRSPYHGITYFEKYDNEEVYFYEEGERSDLQWCREEFYPRTGEFRRLYRDAESGYELEIKLNQRTGRGFGTFGSLKPAEWELIDRMKQKFDALGVDTNTPEGYPEISATIESLQSRENIHWSRLEPGRPYIGIYGLREEDGAGTKPLRTIHVFRHGATEVSDGIHPIYGKKYDDGGVIIRAQEDKSLGQYSVIEVSTSPHMKYEPRHCVTARDRTAMSSIFNKQGETKLEFAIYELSEDELSHIIRLTPAEMNPWITMETSREGLCIRVSIEGLQYEKWGAKASEFREEPRYIGVNRTNYQRAIDIMIRRFGAEEFAKQVEISLINHLHGLHTDLHRRGTPYAPHTDISPLGAEYMRLAQEVIAGAHPLSQNMTENGHVVNAIPLYGDEDFWYHMRENYPALFFRFTDFLRSLPSDFDQKGTYMHADVDPVGLIQQYFPLAHREIIQADPTFVSDIPEAIRNLRSRSQARR